MSYDVIIIGGGHNGLVASFYLAKSGLKTLVLERREVVGGGAVTEELAPGFRCSTLDHVTGPISSQVAADLNLSRHGLEMITPEARVLGLSPDGRSLCIYNDVAATVTEIEKFYRETVPAQKSALLQEQLGDIYKAKGKLLDALDPYAKALQGNLAPLRRLRLVLKVGPLFSSMGRAEQAYALYQGVLRDYPEYPDKKELYEKLAAVATRLKKEDEASDYQRLAKDSGKL